MDGVRFVIGFILEIPSVIFGVLGLVFNCIYVASYCLIAKIRGDSKECIDIWANEFIARIEFVFGEFKDLMDFMK